MASKFYWQKCGLREAARYGDRVKPVGRIRPMKFGLFDDVDRNDRPLAQQFDERLEFAAAADDPVRSA
jgi:hypothetical protein